MSTPLVLASTRCLVSSPFPRDFLSEHTFFFPIVPLPPPSLPHVMRTPNPSPKAPDPCLPSLASPRSASPFSRETPAPQQASKYRTTRLLVALLIAQISSLNKSLGQVLTPDRINARLGRSFVQLAINARRSTPAIVSPLVCVLVPRS